MNITTILLIRNYMLFIAQVWRRGLLYCATRLSSSAAVHMQGTGRSISSGKGSPSTTASSRTTQAGIDASTPRIINPVSATHTALIKIDRGTIMYVQIIHDSCTV